ncbi:MAG: DUF3105 domain-containing protein [Thermomicrobiales bacterium]
MPQITTKRERGERLRLTREERALAQVRTRRRHTLAAVVGAVVVAGLLIVGIVLIVSRSGSSAAPIGITVASEGSASHVPDGSTLTYKHYPPSSGHHYPSPASAGFSAKAIPEGNWVHSLEHGYVVILYKPTASGAPSEAQLRDIMATFPTEKHGSVKIVITPYDHMDSPITAVAWERQLSLDQFNRDQLLQFYNAYVDHGPEDVP